MPRLRGRRLEVYGVPREVRDHALDRLDAHDLATCKLTGTTCPDERAATTVFLASLEAALRHLGDVSGSAKLKSHRSLVAQEPPVYGRMLALEVVALSLGDEGH